MSSVLCHRCGSEIPLPTMWRGDFLLSAYGHLCLACAEAMPPSELLAEAAMTRLAAEFVAAGVSYEFPDG